MVELCADGKPVLTFHRLDKPSRMELWNLLQAGYTVRIIDPVSLNLSVDWS